METRETETIRGEESVGIYTDIHEDLYRTFNAVSYSDLKAWVRPWTGSEDAMRIGKAMHYLILEPGQAKQNCWTTPRDVDRRTTEGRELWETWTTEYPNKVLVMPKERRKLVELVRAVKENDRAMQIINAPGDNEVSVVTKFKDRRVLSKCRVDMLRKGSLWDLKTTGKSTQEEFEQSIGDFAYDAQAAYYADQVAAHSENWRPFGWICVSTRSYRCWVSMAQPYHYAAGRRWYNDLLDLYERYSDE